MVKSDFQAEARVIRVFLPGFHGVLVISIRISDCSTMTNDSNRQSLESTFSESTLNELLDAARQGSSSELGRLLDSFRPALTQMAEEKLGQRIRRRMSMSDLVQDTMLTAAKQFADFRGASPVEFQRWLHELFHSRLVDGLRRHQQAEKRRQNLELEQISLSGLKDSGETPSALASLNEDARRLLEALQVLPEDSQQIIRMRYLEDCTFEKIAADLNVSLSTVWRRFQEAAEMLHSKLQG